MHSDYFPDCFYRLSVKGLYVRDGKLLMVKESSKLSGKWELPGGGLDFGENIQEGLKREIEEEMGLKVLSISNQPVYVWTSRFEPNIRNIGWYYSVVVGYKVELASLDMKPTDECEQIGMFTLDDLKNLDIHSQVENIRNLFNPLDFVS